jgi:hypothetical protein
MMSNRDYASTAAVVRGGRYPFKNLSDRDKAYLTFWSDIIDRFGGKATLKQIAESGEYPDYHGSRKPHDAGVVNRLIKAGLIVATSDGHSIALTEAGRRLSIGAGVNKEIERLVRLGKIASRPGQKDFSVRVRKAYGGKCAITNCSTTEALQAAHIRVDESHRRDFDDTSNGILLRADVHALFDAGLITLTSDGSALELSEKLTDTSYDFLRKAKVIRPQRNAPSAKNIAHHRNWFAALK